MTLCYEQVENPRTGLAYKFRVNAGATIDLTTALRAAGVSCDGCADCCPIPALPAACAGLSAASPPMTRVLLVAGLKHPMPVSTYSQSFHADHDSINAHGPVSLACLTTHDVPHRSLNVASYG